MNVSGAPSVSINASEPVRDAPSQPTGTATPKSIATAPNNEASKGKSPAQAVPTAENRPAKQSPEGGTGFGLRRSDQFVFAIVATVILALLVLHWVRVTRWGTVSVEIERLKERRLDYRLDINAATWVEWTQLEGIGDALARRIVSDREANGPFSSIDDLRRVKGIGPKTLEKIRPWLTNESDSAAASGTKAAYSNRTDLTGR